MTPHHFSSKNCCKFGFLKLSTVFFFNKLSSKKFLTSYLGDWKILTCLLGSQGQSLKQYHIPESRGDLVVIPVKCTEWTPDQDMWLDFQIGGKLYFDFSVTDAEAKKQIKKNFLQGEEICLTAILINTWVAVAKTVHKWQKSKVLLTDKQTKQSTESPTNRPSNEADYSCDKKPIQAKWLRR